MIAMKISVMFSTLVVILMCHSTTASQRHSQPWLAVLSFTCHDSAKNCIGVVLDKHWVLTNAACFWKCKVKLPMQMSVYVDIPPEAQKKLKSSMDKGNEVNGTLVWQHPEYNSRTFANDLALVKLGCHNHTLEKLNLASNCSVQANQYSNSDGYVYVKKNSIKFKEVHDKDSNSVKCFSRQGTGTLYHAGALKMVATTSNNPGCTVTLICKHHKQLKSFMQENEPHCEPSSVVMSTSAKATEMSTTIRVPQTTIQIPQTPISREPPMPTIMPSPTSTSTHVQVPVSNVMENPVIPSLVQVSTLTLDLVPTPTVSTKALNPTQAPYKKLQFSTEFLIIPTSAITSSTITGALTIDVSSQLPAATPTIKTTPNSKCLLTIPNGEATYTEPFTGFLLITYTCNPGYHFVTESKTPQTYGCVNGTMTIEPLPCELIACPPIDAEAFANGTVKVSGSVLDSTATYRCNEGFVLSGGFTKRVCMENGQWSGTAGVCKRVCPVPQSLVCNDKQKFFPLKGRFTYGNVGDTVNYNVNKGYVLIGEPSVCQSNSTWSPQPKCIKLCDETQTIEHATIAVQHDSEYSSYIRKITCDEGYRPKGSTEQYCDIGKWTPHFYECTKLCDQFTVNNGTLTHKMHGNIQIVHIACNEGYNLEPPDHHTVVCSNSQWTSAIPQCVKTNKHV